jgi:hypothetical protein
MLKSVGSKGYDTYKNYGIMRLCNEPPNAYDSNLAPSLDGLRMILNKEYKTVTDTCGDQGCGIISEKKVPYKLPYNYLYKYACNPKPNCNCN